MIRISGKLWDKGYEVDDKIAKFTVGNDPFVDKALIKYDCIGSKAHAKMLKKIGILTSKELEALIKALDEIMAAGEDFEITYDDEDCHTAIENYLVMKTGEAGKKIHTARSRNDQVLTAIRLYQKEHIEKVKVMVKAVIFSIEKKIEEYGKVSMPGFTHMRKAMPSSVRMLFGSYKDALSDDIKHIEYVQKLIDQSPLGSAAGFGVPFEVDRKMAANEMGFASVMENPMYCQHSRGKYDIIVSGALSQIMYDFNKIATDLTMFSMPSFGFFKLPNDICTGSSIMPQKKNPDVLELVRAKYSVIVGEEMKAKSISAGLISGYNRDLQLSKESMVKCFEIAESCLDVMVVVFDDIKVDKEACEKAMTPELYATEEAYKLVREGVPFRDAYKEIGKKFL